MPLNGDDHWMQLALDLARRAAAIDEVPVGAVLIVNDALIGSGWNQPIATCDPTAHAEILALRSGGMLQKNYRLGGATLYSTLEPCAMCMGAVLNARVSRVVFGAWDAKAGACGSVMDLSRTSRLHHRVDVFGGVCIDESARLLREFFEAKR